MACMAQVLVCKDGHVKALAITLLTRAAYEVGVSVQRQASYGSLQYIVP